MRYLLVHNYEQMTLEYRYVYAGFDGSDVIEVSAKAWQQPPPVGYRPIAIGDDDLSLTFLGYDVGHFTSSDNKYSIIVNFLIHCNHDKIRLLNSHLLFSSSDDAEELISLWLAQDDDLEEFEEEEFPRVIPVYSARGQ